MGKVIASYDVKITLRERDDLPLEEWSGAKRSGAGAGPEPTIDELTDLIETKLYDELPYFTGSEINATATRTDE